MHLVVNAGLVHFDTISIICFRYKLVVMRWRHDRSSVRSTDCPDASICDRIWTNWLSADQQRGRHGHELVRVQMTEKGQEKIATAVGTTGETNCFIKTTLILPHHSTSRSDYYTGRLSCHVSFQSEGPRQKHPIVLTGRFLEFCIK
jgi:hypothetical protein